MAQTNYTPISLYYSTTASAVPTAANLVPGELAINTNDGKLYYEDSSGVVQVLATKSTGSIGGSNTQVQFNNSGSLGGSSSFTWDGTTVTATKFAGAFNGTVGATTASTGAFTTLSTSSTTTLSGLTASTALALDASKNVVSVTNTGTGNNVLSASPTLTGTIAGASLSLSSLTSGRVTFAGASGLLSDSANLTTDSTNLSLGAAASNYRLNIKGAGSVGDSSVYAQFTTLDTGTTSGDGLLIGMGVGSSPTAYILQFENAPLAFSTNGAERMRIDSSGTLLVGTTTDPTTGGVSRGIVSVKQLNDTGAFSGLQIEANANTNLLGIGYDGSKFTLNASYRTTGGFVPIAFNVGNSERARIDTSGNLFVNCTTTPSASVGGVQLCNPAGTACKLSAGTATSFVSYLEIINGNGLIGSITGSGSLTSYNVTSDSRLKTNVVDAPSGNIDSIKVRSFDWIADGSHQEYGMIAQELHEVAPYAVSKFENPDEMMGVDYSKLVPMMIKEIQDLKQRIATLENK